jgi:hypothetical protein
MERLSGPIKKKPSGHKLFPKGFRSPESENRTFPIVFPHLCLLPTRLSVQRDYIFSNLSVTAGQCMLLTLPDFYCQLLFEDKSHEVLVL